MNGEFSNIYFTSWVDAKLVREMNEWKHPIYSVGWYKSELVRMNREVNRLQGLERVTLQRKIAKYAHIVDNHFEYHPELYL